MKEYAETNKQDVNFELLAEKVRKVNIPESGGLVSLSTMATITFHSTFIQIYPFDFSARDRIEQALRAAGINVAKQAESVYYRQRLIVHAVEQTI